MSIENGGPSPEEMGIPPEGNLQNKKMSRTEQLHEEGALDDQDLIPASEVMADFEERASTLPGHANASEQSEGLPDTTPERELTTEEQYQQLTDNLDAAKTRLDLAHKARAEGWVDNEHGGKTLPDKIHQEESAAYKVWFQLNHERNTFLQENPELFDTLAKNRFKALFAAAESAGVSPEEGYENIEALEDLDKGKARQLIPEKDRGKVKSIYQLEQDALSEYRQDKSARSANEAPSFDRAPDDLRQSFQNEIASRLEEDKKAQEVVKYDVPKKMMALDKDGVYKVCIITSEDPERYYGNWGDSHNIASRFEKASVRPMTLTEAAQVKGKAFSAIAIDPYKTWRRKAVKLS